MMMPSQCYSVPVSLTSWRPVRAYFNHLSTSRRSPLSTSTHATICRASLASPQNSAETLSESSQNGADSPPSSLRYGVAAVQGPRETMEDVTQVVEDGYCGFLFATVFDGHAGIAAAEYLRDNLYRVFGEQLNMQDLGLDCSLEQREEGLCCPLELHTVLTACYQRADESLVKWLKKQPGEEAEAGCTATTVLIRSDRVIVANVGDSRAVLCRSGNAMDLSTEHRVYGRGSAVASETARVESVGGWIDDGRVCGVLAVSRAFGDADFKGEGLPNLVSKGVKNGLWTSDFAAKVKFTGDPVTSEPDVFEMTVDVGKDEFLVVATDGLWDVLSSQEVIQLARNDLKRGKSPEEIAERLTTIAVKRHTADNVAIVVVDLLGADGWKRISGGTKKKKMFGLF